MEKFENKLSCNNKAGCPQKRIKLESDERTKQQEDDEEDEFSHPVPWKKIESEGLDCDYALLLPKEEADHLFKRLEEEVVYSTGEEAKVRVFGKVHGIPRKQATYGDAGLTYTYSGVTRLACPWTPTLEHIRDVVTKTTGQTFNFVLVNRYKDGQDHMGEHRDDEKELDPLCPIASVSLGAARDFVFRHRDARGKHGRRQIDPVKLELAHGSLLLMNSRPTLSGTTASLSVGRFPCLVSTSPSDASYRTERNERVCIITQAGLWGQCSRSLLTVGPHILDEREDEPVAVLGHMDKYHKPKMYLFMWQLHLGD